MVESLYKVKNPEDFQFIWKDFNIFRDNLNDYYPLAESDIDDFMGEIKDVGIRDSLINFMVGTELIEEHFEDSDQSMVQEGWHFIHDVEEYLNSEKTKSPDKHSTL